MARLPSSSGYTTTNNYILYRIETTEGTYDSSARKRQVTVNVIFWRTNNYTTHRNGTVYCKINGTTYTSSLSASNSAHIISSSDNTLFSKTIDVYYDDAGNASLSVSAWIVLFATGSTTAADTTSSEQGGSVALTNVGAATVYIWNDINALNPSGVQDNASALFDLSYSDGSSYSNLTNEMDATKPYGTVMTISNIRPYHSYYELDYVNGATHNGSGVYTNTMTTQNHIVEIKMKYKTYTLTVNPNGGSFNGGGTSSINMSPLLQYNSSTWCDVSNYIPVRPGYEFLGFYDANGTIVYDSNGASYSTAHWHYNGTTHVYVYEDNLTVYAQWKPLNIAYLKKDESWVLCNTYVKDNGSWKPAILKNIDKE